MVRRLPVLSAPSGEDAEAAERPAWRWVVIGALAVVCLFLPVSLLGLALGQRLARGASVSPAAGAALAAAPLVVAFAACAWAAGALTGRFGLRTRPRHGVAAGVLGAAGVLALAALGLERSSLLPALAGGVVLLALGGTCAGLGARSGVRRRP